MADIILLDGAMGSLLGSWGLPAGLPPERVNAEHGELVSRAHAAYLAAGSELITANCFAAMFPAARRDRALLDDCVKRGMELAKNAAERHGAGVVLGLGPTGELLEPYGTLSEAELEDTAAHICELGAQFEPEFVLFETETNLAEALAGLRGARAGCALPAGVTFSFEKSGRTMFGDTPEDAVLQSEAAGAFAVGVNCGFGPDLTLPVFTEMARFASAKLIAQPNAGLPRMENGRPVYDLPPEAFAEQLKPFIPDAAFLGGCCGTTPGHISALKNLIGK